ncbi:glutaredoxin domain-containing protein [Nocardia salmonicida]|uniref:glutaredoxin domain-containing protein n=1 Tax=Nocardia salmonicida TaxID=53431 RepID=UPI0033C6FC4F
MYSKDNCGQCRATKAYLLKHEISFAEINISENLPMVEALIEQGYREVPVIEWTVGEASGSWTGFESENIEALVYLIKGD